MNKVYEKLLKCFKTFEKKIDFKPDAALVLGSGLGGYADSMKISAILDYSDIEDFPVSTVSGHRGRFVFGYVEDVPVVCMQGRVHYYEGYSMSDVVLPVRLMKLMGAKTLFLTNAAGGIDESLVPGDLMLITGQISSFVPSPLIGENIDELGTRFPDMSGIYDKDLQEIIRAAALENGIALKEGVYLQTSGPNYESPEEVKMYKSLGASAVGMSTACEAIAAKHMGMKICGISCISNMAAGISQGPLSHEEIKAAADKSASMFKRLVTKSVIKISKMPCLCEVQ